MPRPTPSARPTSCSRARARPADNIVGGPEHSTLANDAFPSREFDFMLSNPPCGKSWKTDLERMGGKKDMRDPRFVIKHGDDSKFSLVTPLQRRPDAVPRQQAVEDEAAHPRSAAALLRCTTAAPSSPATLAKARATSAAGSSRTIGWRRSSPCRSTCSTTPASPPYVWVLTNRKPAHREGKVQLIDATGWHRPLRKNLGKKNCELSEDDIARICEAFLAFEESGQSKIFDNAAFGYWKVTVERPLRIEQVDPNRAYKAAEIRLLKEHGTRGESAPPVIRRIHKRSTEPNPLCGLFETTVDGRPAVVEYEPDTDLRDTEQIPLQEVGGIETFLRREVLPYAADAWYQSDSVKVGYEISFNRYFYKPQPMRSLEEIRADILALEKETEGLLDEILATGSS